MQCVLTWRRTKDVLSQEEDVVAVRVWLQGVVSGRCGGHQGVVTGCCLRKTWWPSGCGYREAGTVLQHLSTLLKWSETHLATLSDAPWSCCLIRAPEQSRWRVKLIRSQICSSTHFTTYPSLTKPSLCVKPFIESTLFDTQTSQPQGFLLAVQLEMCRCEM